MIIETVGGIVTVAKEVAVEVTEAAVEAAIQCAEELPEKIGELSVAEMLPEKIELIPEINLPETVNTCLELNEMSDISYEDKVLIQDKEISDVETGEKAFDRANTHETGNYGEMKMDQDLRDKGYDRISKEMVTDIDSKTHQGLDGVYYNPDGEPPYIIADAKYGTSQLAETLDGKQMSDSWIDARLDKDVGIEKADEIRMEKILNPDNVGSYVGHVDAEGNVIYDKLDGEANVIEKDVKING
jgi:hypothetical protein